MPRQDELAVCMPPVCARIYLLPPENKDTPKQSRLGETPANSARRPLRRRSCARAALVCKFTISIGTRERPLRAPLCFSLYLSVYRVARVQQNSPKSQARGQG
jgi:hypothetical protein